MKALATISSGLAAALVITSGGSAWADNYHYYQRAPAAPEYRRPLRWSTGIHLTGLSENQKIDGEGVALGGMGWHLRYRGYRLGGEFTIDGAANDFLGGRVSRVTVPVQLSALLYLIPQGFFNLYLLGGLQVAFTDVNWNLPNLHDDQLFTQFGAQAGVGTELSLGRVFVLTADVRFFGRIRTDSGPAGSYYQGIDERTVVPKNTAGAQFNLGASFRF